MLLGVLEWGTQQIVGRDMVEWKYVVLCICHLLYLSARIVCEGEPLFAIAVSKSMIYDYCL
jgi:hypothetical protein